MYLFIDTNIYLDFYHFSSDDLEELKKLHVAITSGPINLLTTTQLVDEFKRNREGKIADALKQSREQKFPKKFPQLYKDFPEFKDIQECIKNYEILSAGLLDKLLEAIKNKNLKADDEVDFLFSHSVSLESTQEIYSLAQKRTFERKPPGKNNSAGDAIIWETLLSEVPVGEDLFFVSGDVDYASPLNDRVLSDYLRQEWIEKKSSNIFFFNRLSSFFATKYPQIKLATELERVISVGNLINSGSFQTTHSSIAKINLEELTDLESLNLLQASIENEQIFWIAGDDDVQSIFQALYFKYGEHLDPISVQKFEELYMQRDMPISLDEIPF